ncbi:MAG: dihydrofolate reductase [bacterium]|nr:dihydrofolate reductase [bacterium]
MLKPRISIIVSLAQNRAIGSKNGLLWRIPEDLSHFKKITIGHPVIMGRKTHDSIGKVLPGRTNIIVTKDLDYKVEGGVVVNSLDQAIELALRYSQGKLGNEEVFIIGGGQIYEQALPVTYKLYLTIVEGDYPQADTFFPDYSDFKKVVYEGKGESDGYKYKFLELER